MYVAAVEALRKMETQGETQVYHQNRWKTSLGPNYFLL
jgi:hypothetical protein